MVWSVTVYGRSVGAEILALPAEGFARVFYCTVMERRIVVLRQFVKKSDKTPRKGLEVALRRLTEVEDV